jgi:hypothetical protein
MLEKDINTLDVRKKKSRRFHHTGCDIRIDYTSFINFVK